jgi:6-phosphogluconate dehydrogenase (decarboxylating)
MQIGMIGLGRMGANMARRLARGGASVIAWDKAAPARRALARERRIAAAPDLASLVEKLKTPRVLWLMLPAGAATEGVLTTLQALLAKGDVLVDGANANYRDSMRRAAALAERGLQYTMPASPAAYGAWPTATPSCSAARRVRSGGWRLSSNCSRRLKAGCIAVPAALDTTSR